MKTFNYKTFMVGYKLYKQNTYMFALITRDKKILIQDFLTCENELLVEQEIIKKLNTLLAKQKIGIFRIEIMFAQNTWQPYVCIWLPSDELIADELKTIEKNVPKILLNMKKMLTEDLEKYKGYTIVDYTKYGDNLQQRNLCAFTINRRGQYECMYDDNKEELKSRIDRLLKN